MNLTAVPPHAPCGREGLGTVGDDNALVCIVRRRWIGYQPHDSEGCGIRFEMCSHGLHACCVCHREEAA